MRNRILFYSSVKKLSFFNTQRFYQIDIDILQNLGFDVTTTNRKRDFIRFWKYDISFLYFYKWSFLPAFLSFIFGKKSYFTGGIDDLSLPQNSIKYKKQKILFKICYFLSTKCFIVSNNDFTNVKKIIKSQTTKLYLSLHTIDTTNISIIPSRMKSNNFVSIAWMHSIDNVKRKGLDKALIIFSKLINSHLFSDSMFLIAGSQGDGSLYLQELCQKLKIEDKVKFLGVIEESDKIHLLKSNKYYFQLSEYEGFGLAALEALAAGAIVIHSGRGGLSESIGNDGIQIEIMDSLSKQCQTILLKLFDIDDKKMNQIHRRVITDFSNSRRETDFLCNIGKYI